MNLIPGKDWADIVSSEVKEKWTRELDFKIHSTNLNNRENKLYIDPSDV